MATAQRLRALQGRLALVLQTGAGTQQQVSPCSCAERERGKERKRAQIWSVLHPFFPDELCRLSERCTRLRLGCGDGNRAGREALFCSHRQPDHQLEQRIIQGRPERRWHSWHCEAAAQSNRAITGQRSAMALETGARSPPPPPPPPKVGTVRPSQSPPSLPPGCPDPLRCYLIFFPLPSALPSCHCLRPFFPPWRSKTAFAFTLP